MEKMKRTIMIADDDLGILDAISVLLEFEGYEVLTGQDCSALLNNELPIPDILLLDIWMSGTDGRDTCKILKQNETTAQLPIIMISASKDIGPSAIAAGANDFLEKPFQMEDLLIKIKKLCA